ncbi:MAG TPA: HD-GYP domain-containing protein [Methylophilus sp.]|nr:HD-GYP domain-containing protein [Methylophilus sp.]HQQ33679.1 HD-GYP domain-containing protein [Methylophilus sp.]
MLKTIPVHQVRMGMFIHSLKGSWIDHPFWKKAFKLEDADDLNKLHSSGVREVVIDTSKGLDVATEKPIEIAEALIAETRPAALKHSKHTSIDEERVHAKRIIEGTKQAVASMFDDVRMGKAINAEAASPLVEEISASLARNEGALISLVRLKASDDYTYMHSVAVCALMISLARELRLHETEVRQAGLGGLLHDIGKALIPIEVLSKPGALTEEEFKIVRLHPERGHALLQQGQITDEVILDICLHHHEKMDGTGYPFKLGGDQISLFAKMGAVCDVYDAITSNRPYKAGWEPGVSLHRMAQWGNHFDQKVFQAFVKCVGIYPIGSIVMLKSGRLGLVIDQSPKSLLTPIVRVFFSTKSKTHIPMEVLDLSRPGSKDSILGHEDPIKWGITDINALWNQNDLW